MIPSNAHNIEQLAIFFSLVWFACLVLMVLWNLLLLLFESRESKKNFSEISGREGRWDQKGFDEHH